MITARNILIQEIGAAEELLGHPTGEGRRKVLAGMTHQKLIEEVQLIYLSINMRHECESIVANRRLIQREVGGDGNEKI